MHFKLAEKLQVHIDQAAANQTAAANDARALSCQDLHKSRSLNRSAADLYNLPDQCASSDMHTMCYVNTLVHSTTDPTR